MGAQGGIRQRMGDVQFWEDVLQDMLTPVEHLLFFGRLKNLQASTDFQTTLTSCHRYSEKVRELPVGMCDEKQCYLT